MNTATSSLECQMGAGRAVLLDYTSLVSQAQPMLGMTTMVMPNICYVVTSCLFHPNTLVPPPDERLKSETYPPPNLSHHRAGFIFTS